MSQCQVRDEPSVVLYSTPFLLVLTLVWLDLSLTFTGIEVLEGVSEANPIYAWFVEQGTGWMFIGGIIYVVLLFLWFQFLPGWARSISAGALVSIHLWGVMSWLRNWFSTFDIFFDFWWTLVLPPILGATVTLFTFVYFQSCPGIPGRRSEFTLYL